MLGDSPVHPRCGCPKLQPAKFLPRVVFSEPRLQHPYVLLRACFCSTPRWLPATGAGSSPCPANPTGLLLGSTVKPWQQTVLGGAPQICRGCRAVCWRQRLRLRLPNLPRGSCLPFPMNI